MGGNLSYQLDVRIVAASRRELLALTAAGEFRDDLYYRLGVFPMALPPLRQRPEDVAPLTQALLHRLQQQKGVRLGVTDAAMALLERYPWPGNVRELENLVDRLAIEYPGEIVGPAELPDSFRHQPRDPEPALCGLPPHLGDGEPNPEALARLPLNGLDLKEYLGRVERRLIEQALDDTGSVVARAADRLHVRRTTLVEKMRKYGIDRG